ncbi:Uncharacterized membrane protein [Tindallia magadiensis]|uniref:Uncharacterized membrane protein n=1 Tax=Tindallia magadiensis TaxID=69895 RepID=A0A1I3B1F7_9FIRM|nr:DUF2177 family protein [Tindallia magadiensis]SFH56147.1 Uncharacterized membrane protein [Tindallia magadiensis]
MYYWLRIYFIAIIVFFSVDLLWLGLIAKPFYQKQIGFLLSSRVNWPAAVIFYLLYIGGMVYFVLRPALQQDSWVVALYTGALFGFITYATYDLTNLATIKNWPLLVTIVDLLWGTFLGASVSTATFLILESLKWNQ